MRSSILLSGKRDPDLIALYKSVGNKAFSNMVKDALRMVVRENYNSIHKPQNLTLQGNLKEDTIKFNLILTSEKDEDVRELLSHILPGEISAFIKQALRFYLGPAAVLSGFMNSDFSDMLKSNPIPVQVFVIGEQKTPQKKPNVKRTRKPAQRKPQKDTSFGYSSFNTPMPVDDKISFSEHSNTEIIGTNKTWDNPKASEVITVNDSYSFNENINNASDEVSEEDMMLAMLEGLLG